MKRILTITLLVFAVTVAHGQRTNVLILYDASGGFGWIGNLHAKMLANLLGHFDLSWQIQPVESYVEGQADRARATFYLGLVYDNPLPAAFTNDVVTTTNRVCWFKYNLWQVSGTPASPRTFDALYGFRFLFNDSSGYSNILYKGETFLKDQSDSELGVVDILAPGLALTPMTAWKTNAGLAPVSVPYVVHASNFWYVADSPFSFIAEDDRYVAFADLLHDILVIDHAESHQAIIRFEDVTMRVYETNELRAAVDYLRTNSVPFGLAFIPVYADPLGYYTGGFPEEHHISDLDDPTAVAFRDTAQYAVTNGGQILIHGYTHQYQVTPNPLSGTTADDYEFWQETYSVTNPAVFDLFRPVPEDSPAWAFSRVVAATNELFHAGLPWVGWEVPHYTASDADYRVFATNFPLTMQRILCFADDYAPTNNHLGGQFFPYVINRDIYGQKVVPENLGYFGPNAYVAYTGRSAADIIRSARRNLAVRDGWACAFYHGFYAVSNLQTIIEGVKALGYTYVPVAPAGEPVITFQPRSQTALTGSVGITLSVAAIGSAPFSYQWACNNTNLPAATNAILVLPAIQPEYAGTYTVTVTNPAGMATSAPAQFRVVSSLPAVYISHDANPTPVILFFDSISGVLSHVEYRDSFTTSGWLPFTNVNGNGTTMRVDLPADAAARYFRVWIP